MYPRMDDPYHLVDVVLQVEHGVLAYHSIYLLFVRIRIVPYGGLWSIVTKSADRLCSRLEDHARDDLIQSQKPISWIVGSAYFV